jgi:hypothetical protein
MNNIEKCIAWFDMMGIRAGVIVGDVFIQVLDFTVQISQSEIDYRAEEYDKEIENGDITFLVGK